MAAAADREGAVREVAQVYELIKTHHQPLLLLLAPHANEHKLAHTLLGEALRALNVALSVMAAAPAPAPAPAPAAGPASVKAEPPQALSSSSSPANSGGSLAAECNCKQASTARRAAKKRRSNEEERWSWVNMTTVPHEDGYQCRKYGEKAIHGTPFTRSYFRCTYKDDKGCLATKQIQQKDSSDPPMFQVTYTNDHTCNANAYTPPAPPTSAAGDDLAAGTKHPAGHVGIIVKHEPQAAAAVAAMAPTPAPCQESLLLPLDSYSHSGLAPYDSVPPAASAAGSCSNSASAAAYCDEPELGRTAAAAVMEQEAAAQLGDLDPFFCDPYLLLLYDSFKYY